MGAQQPGRHSGHSGGQQSGAHLSVLRRTKIGDFKVDNAKTIDAFLKSLPSE